MILAFEPLCGSSASRALLSGSILALGVVSRRRLLNTQLEEHDHGDRWPSTLQLRSVNSTASQSKQLLVRRPACPHTPKIIGRGDDPCAHAETARSGSPLLRRR